MEHWTQERYDAFRRVTMHSRRKPIGSFIQSCSAQICPSSVCARPFCGK